MYSGERSLEPGTLLTRIHYDVIVAISTAAQKAQGKAVRDVSADDGAVSTETSESSGAAAES